MTTEWNGASADLRLSVSRDALRRARFAVGAQAQLLAEQMERGSLPSFEGPDALRLFAMILGDESMVTDPAGEFCAISAQMRAGATSRHRADPPQC